MEKTSTSSDGLHSSQETQTPRIATEADIPHILELAHKFVGASPYRDVGLDVVAVENVIVHLINSESGAIFVSDRGFLAGALTPLFFHPDVVVATELAWYAPGAGGTTFREMFEDWSRDNGAAAVQMNTLNNEFAGDLASNLTQNGYTPVEVSYLKAI